MVTLRVRQVLVRLLLSNGLTPGARLLAGQSIEYFSLFSLFIS